MFSRASSSYFLSQPKSISLDFFSLAEILVLYFQYFITPQKSIHRFQTSTIIANRYRKKLYLHNTQFKKNSTAKGGNLAHCLHSTRFVVRPSPHAPSVSSTRS